MLLVVIAAILISSIITEPAYAIQCYNCESIADSNCGEDFSMEEFFKIDCDQVAPPRYLSYDSEYLNATACMKKIYKEHKVLKYIRSCYFGDGNDTGCRMDPTMMDFQDIKCFVCDNENFCNSALTSKVLNRYFLQYSALLLLFTVASHFT